MKSLPSDSNSSEADSRAIGKGEQAEGLGERLGEYEDEYQGGVPGLVDDLTEEATKTSKIAAAIASAAKDKGDLETQKAAIELQNTAEHLSQVNKELLTNTLSNEENIKALQKQLAAEKEAREKKEQESKDASDKMAAKLKREQELRERAGEKIAGGTALFVAGVVTSSITGALLWDEYQGGKKADGGNTKIRNTKNAFKAFGFIAGVAAGVGGLVTLRSAFQPGLQLSSQNQEALRLENLAQRFKRSLARFEKELFSHYERKKRP